MERAFAPTRRASGIGAGAPGMTPKIAKANICRSVDGAIRFFITRGLVALVVARASVLLLHLDVGKTGEGMVPGRL